jgi:hypothetical protein
MHGQDLDYEHRFVMPDGSVKFVHAVTHAGSNHAARSEHVGAVVDVTAAKHAEEKLHKAQTELAHVTRVTMLGEMTASISHEVNCLVPDFDGASLSDDSKEALWDKYYTAAPRRRRQSVEQYKIVKRA